MNIENFVRIEQETLNSNYNLLVEFAKRVSETPCLCKVKERYPNLNVPNCIGCEAKDILNKIKI
jgi:phosphomevalonate kinase